MIYSIFSHWKTTLAGLLVAAAGVSVNGMTLKQFGLGFLVALLGALAHDPTWLKSANPTKISLILVFLGLSLVPANAQTPAPLPSNVYALGFSYNAAGSPKVAGDFAYGHLLSDGTGTYSFSFVDVLPLKGQPSAVSTSVSTGLAQKVLTLGKAHAFVASGIGVQTDGRNMGWDWNGGVLLDYPIAKGWGIEPNARFDKGSATENYGYRFIAGVMLRFGK